MEDTVQNNWSTVFKNTMELIQNNTQYYHDDKAINSASRDQKNIATSKYRPVTPTASTNNIESENSAYQLKISNTGHSYLQNLQVLANSAGVQCVENDMYTQIQENSVTSSDDTRRRCNKAQETQSNNGNQQASNFHGSQAGVISTMPQVSSAQVQLLNSYHQGYNAQLQFSHPYIQGNGSQQQQPNGSYLQGNSFQQLVNQSYLQGTQHQANSSQHQANSSYLQGNTSQHQANSSYLQGNTSQHQANSSYLQGNNSQHQANSSYLQGNNSQHQTNSSYLQGNNSQHQANGSFMQSHSPQEQQQVKGSYTQDMNSAQQQMINSYHQRISPHNPVNLTINHAHYIQHIDNRSGHPNTVHPYDGREQNVNNGFHQMNYVNNSQPNVGYLQSIEHSQHSICENSNDSQQSYCTNTPLNNATLLLASRDGTQLSSQMNTVSQDPKNIQKCTMSNPDTEQSEFNKENKTKEPLSNGSLLKTKDQDSATPSNNQSLELKHTPHPEHVTGRFVRTKRPLFVKNKGVRGSRSKYVKVSDQETKTPRPDVQNRQTPPENRGNHSNNVNEPRPSVWQPWL